MSLCSNSYAVGTSGFVCITHKPIITGLSIISLPYLVTEIAYFGKPFDVDCENCTQRQDPNIKWKGLYSKIEHCTIDICMITVVIIKECYSSWTEVSQPLRLSIVIRSLLVVPALDRSVFGDNQGIV